MERGRGPDVNAHRGFASRPPGVHLEEVFPEAIEAFRPGVPAIVGFTRAAQKNPDAVRGGWDTAALSRWDEYAERVGPAVPDGFIDRAVRGFFENGGERCVVVSSVLPKDGLVGLTSALEGLFKERGALEDVEDVDLICVPDLMMEAIRASPDDVVALQLKVLDYCRRMGDRFAILDTFPAAGDDTRIEDAVGHWHALRSSFGALYYPWIEAGRPRSPGESAGGRDEGACRFVPPCGHVAGVYARSDGRVGVHKAPANEVLEGVVDLEVDLSDAEHARLNAVGVNCIRALPGRGIRVWGARTLSGQPGWRYVNVRRLFLALSRWLEHNMKDLVFEPHGPPLWERVRQRLGAYCYELLQRGAIQGRGAEEAYFVKCDAETNPPEVRESGRLVADIGLAPVAPAEFVIVRITQSVAGITVGEPTAS